MIKTFVLYTFLFNLNYVFSQNTNMYETSWQKDGIISGLGILSGISGIALDNSDLVKIEDIKKLDRNDLNFLDKSASYNNNQKLSNLSDGLVLTALVSPILFIVDDNIKKEWEKITLMYIENTLLAATLPSLGKASYRLRPYAYTNIDGVVEGKTQEELLNADTHRSFFSGHTTVAFASCVFVAKVYSDYYPNSQYKNYVWASSILLASSVAYLRYASGYHFPTDILTGAFVGSAIGYIIPELHKIKTDASLKTSIGYNFVGVSLCYKF